MSDKPKQQNFFARHKILTVVLAFLIVTGLLGAAGNSNDSSSTSATSNTSTTTKTASGKTYRFADRADKQPKDVELLPNESGTVGGVKLTVTSVQYATTLGEFDTADDGKTYVVANVTLQNTSDSTKPYNELDFRMQTAGGQVLDGAIVASLTDLLDSGDLVSGGKVSGNVIFQVPVESGHQYLIWKPGLASDRAIVELK